MHQAHTRTGVSRIIYATRYSIQGFRFAWKNEAAFRQEVMVAIPLIIISFFLPVTVVEQILMISSLVGVIICELLNSAIEAVVDRIGPDWHELSGLAKDLGSAAVLVAICLAILTWVLILVVR
ncbi:diacylglycerol kinase [Celerinatantimonas sp. YJH-8]|uniref:diacylglycerol kinase n=1 Tax=Celerinatantimonas sp. YJH-8 TaxID=3228714 RepID=UPI0038BFCCF4